jgi:Fuc2NAc and GlcNAc transferase
MNLNSILTESTMINITIFSCTFIVSLIGVHLYQNIATKTGILANPNFRTLHEAPIPSGGGVIFAFIFLIGVFILWILGLLSDNLLIITGIGGCVATLLGFLDDKNNIKSTKKLAIQIFLSGFALFYLDGGPLLNIDLIPSLVAIPLSILLLVWAINSYNFMDGIDGMAASGTIFSSGTIVLTMVLTNELSEVTILLLLLAVSVLAFMVFNWPPAKIFMGDSGSVFLGYIFGVLILFTTMHNEVSIWTWIIVFGYFISDTTVTQIARLILVKRWYMAHRSHAYQNVARITNSHRKVTIGVIIYSLIWLLPIAIWSVLEPSMAVLATIIALTPALVFSYKNGPVLSST